MCTFMLMCRYTQASCQCAWHAMSWGGRHVAMRAKLKQSLPSSVTFLALEKRCGPGFLMTRLNCKRSYFCKCSPKDWMDYRIRWGAYWNRFLLNFTKSRHRTKNYLFLLSCVDRSSQFSDCGLYTRFCQGFEKLGFVQTFPWSHRTNLKALSKRIKFCLSNTSTAETKKQYPSSISQGFWFIIDVTSRWKPVRIFYSSIWCYYIKY